MTVLSAQSIDLRVRYNIPGQMVPAFIPRPLTLGIEPYVPEAKQTMGMSYGLTSAGYDIRAGDLGLHPDEQTPRGDALWLQPGDFVLIASLERIRVPDDLQVIVHDKSSWARQGLALQNTVLEPGWAGYITLELSNHGKKALRVMRGQPIAQLVFHQLDHPTILPYRGKYQDQGSAPVESLQATCTNCSICGGAQFETSSGVTCSNGHGGADSESS